MSETSTSNCDAFGGLLARPICESEGSDLGLPKVPQTPAMESFDGPVLEQLTMLIDEALKKQSDELLERMQGLLQDFQSGLSARQPGFFFLPRDDQPQASSSSHSPAHPVLPVQLLSEFEVDKSARAANGLALREISTQSNQAPRVTESSGSDAEEFSPAEEQLRKKEENKQLGARLDAKVRTHYRRNLSGLSGRSGNILTSYVDADQPDSAPGSPKPTPRVSAFSAFSAFSQSGQSSTSHTSWSSEIFRLSEPAGTWYFEAFFAFVVVTNSVVIGMQVEQEAVATHSGKVADATGYFIAGIVYTFLFTVELILRLCQEKRKFFWESQNLVWNYLDIAIVAFSLFEVVLAAIVQGEQDTDRSAMATNMRIMRIVRITRLARVLRVLKVIRFIRALRTLVQSILSTLKSLMWALFLLTLIIYVFSLIFTDAVSGYIQESMGETLDANLSLALAIRRFGGVRASMDTLFRSVSNGLDWDDVALGLAEISFVWCYLYTAFIAFCVFAVLNVMTGVFCQSASESAMRDQEALIQTMLLDRQRHASILRDAFEVFEKDGHGTITLLQFERKFEDAHVKAFFQSMEIEPADAWTLFKLLDSDGTGTVDVSSFVEGCMRLRGPARAIDIATLVHESKDLKGRVRIMDERVKHFERTVTGQVFREDKLLRLLS